MKKITVSDITLRSVSAGTFSAGTVSPSSLALSFKEKLTVIRGLDSLHLDYIELEEVRNKTRDLLFIKTAAAEVRHSALSLFVKPGTDAKELSEQYAALSSAGAENPDGHPHRLSVRMPVSTVGLEYSLHRKPAAALELLKTTVAACASLCPDVEFAAEDALRADRAFLASAIEAAADAGAGTITLCDCSGELLPSEFCAFLTAVREEIPVLSTLRLGAECCGNAVFSPVCTVEAAACDSAGVDEIKISSAEGETLSLSAFGQLLRTHGDALGISSRLRTTGFLRTAAQIRGIIEPSSARTPFDNAVSGKNGSNDPEASFELDSAADLSSVCAAASSLGYQLGEEELEAVFGEVKRISGSKKIGPRDLEAIIANSSSGSEQTYRLDNFVITSGNTISSTANVRLIRSGETLEGVSSGNGPIDAALLAIEKIVGHHYELDDFQINSVTGGQGAMGFCLIKLRGQSGLYSGTGVSTDIVGASIRAYLGALNKIVSEGDRK